MRFLLSLIGIVSLACVGVNAGLLAKGQVETALRQANASGNQHSIRVAQDQLKNAEELMKYGAIVMASILGIPIGGAMVAAGKSICLSEIQSQHFNSSFT